MFRLGHFESMHRGAAIVNKDKRQKESDGTERIYSLFHININNSKLSYCVMKVECSSILDCVSNMLIHNKYVFVIHVQMLYASHMKTG